ncbi:Thymidylate kinase [Candidatus Norongarragalina meridionalis]|nr:Thymidylate kinase [Candidatus Norongarragalina meridionalis]
MSFVVFEGGDASGKRTQALMLAKKTRAKYMRFPAYETKYGKLVKQYLKYGASIEEAVLLYSLDRYQFKETMESLLKRGKNIVCDRYTYSNLAFQLSRAPKTQRTTLKRWMEAVDERMPKADAVILLDVPQEFAEKLLEKRGRKKDIHEKNRSYQRRVREEYRRLAKEKKWIVIKCVGSNGRLRTREDIAAEISRRL